MSFDDHFIPFQSFHFQKTLVGYDTLCSFWKYDDGESGKWSSQGCHLVYNNESGVLCECNHLTNFAVLMSPYVAVSFLHDKLLSHVRMILSSANLDLLLCWCSDQSGSLFAGRNTWSDTWVDIHHRVPVVYCWMHHNHLSLFAMLEVSKLSCLVFAVFLA